MTRLTARRVETLRKPGRYSDGHGLMLFVQKAGGRSWVQRLTVGGRRVDRGFGSLDIVSLAEAREWALANKIAARRGEDPFTARVSRVPTFGTAADKVEAAGQWHGRTRENRRAALTTYAGGLMDRRLDQIGREDVLKVLTPIWTTKAPTARTLRGWIRAVFSWGQAHGYIEHNVAGEMIDGALPKVKSTREHRAAVPYRAVGAALHAVDASTTSDIVKACLRFTVLTAVRSGEARLATWSEIDTGARLWTIPAARMKAGAEHRVPLSDAALGVLEAVRPHRRDNDLLFPSVGGRPISMSTIVKALQRAVGAESSVHGFRSSFRDWANEQTNADHAVMELSLAHQVGSAVERAYSRSDLFDKRRALMDQWAAYLTN